MNCKPERKEGFIDAKFIHIDRVMDIVRYEDERRIIKKSLKIIGNDLG